MNKYTPAELINFLKRSSKGGTFIDKLKINYRPYICPFHELLEEIHPTDKVFDIGCGSGQFALLVAEFVKPDAISGIEIENRLIANAKELLKGYLNQTELDFNVFDGEQIPKSIKEHTIVCMIDVLHHIPKNKQISFLENLYANMNPGAKLILKDINKAHVFAPFNKLHDFILSGKAGRELSLRKTKEILQNIGFKIVKQSKKTMFLYPHFTLVMER